jgi:MarR family transcriptional repressor of emrRAB
MYYLAMNKTTELSYQQLQQRIDDAHQRLVGEALVDISLNVLIKHSARLITDLLNRQLKDYGLSYTSYVVLMTLASVSDSRANPSQLCERTGETRANMTRICDELVELGLIRRIGNAEDRRRVDLSLSETGEALLKKVVPEVRSEATRVFSHIGDAEKASLKAGLLKVMAALENEL